MSKKRDVSLPRVAAGSNVNTYFSLGLMLQAKGDFAAAADAFEKAIRVDPKLTAGYVALGKLSAKRGSHALALDYFRRAAKIDNTVPDDTELARLMSHCGGTLDAEKLLRKTIVRDPNAVPAHELLGEVLQQLGRFDDARALYEHVLAKQPAAARSYLGITSSKRITPGDSPLIEKMKLLVQDEDLAPQQRERLHYALGKACDDLGQYEDAIRNFDEAHRLAGRRLEQSGRMLNHKHHVHNIDSLIATFTRELFANGSAFAVDSETPIIIVGMIRSGTTLVEQILSSHGKIGAGGEMRFWGQHGTTVNSVADRTFNKSAAKNLADSYCAALGQLAPGKRRVTDKMPTNYLLLGLVHLILPRARIIHCRREPVDTCLSIYFTPFSGLPDFARDRESIVFYYEQYKRLMEHWRQVLPSDIFLEIEYEKLVAEPERVTREMVTFCGLPWDENCMRHQNNQRDVQTPSMWQVRQPIYHRSAGRWRNYEKWLGAFASLARE